MKIFRLIVSLMAVAILTSTCAAVDLTMIDRTIKKEPTYRHKPKYGLVVFGPEAKTRVWMVVDGDVLYVDRNGNADLTEKGERVEGTRNKRGSVEFDVGDVVGEIMDDDGQIGKCRIGVFIFKDCWAVTGEISRQGAPWIGNCAWFVGTYNVFRGFADEREVAPIIHFSGPLTINLARIPGRVLASGKKTNLISQIGTPGLGEGTFATYMIRPGKKILGGKSPTAVIELVSTDVQGQPVTIRTTLTKRSCGAVFYNTVEISKEAGKLGKAKITLSLPDSEKLKIGKVAPATFEVPIAQPEAAKPKQKP